MIQNSVFFGLSVYPTTLPALKRVVFSIFTNFAIFSLTNFAIFSLRAVTLSISLNLVFEERKASKKQTACSRVLDALDFCYQDKCSHLI